MKQKTIKEWLGSSEYVGLNIICSLWRVQPATEYVGYTQAQFEHYLSNCSVEWSFSKL